MRNGLVRSVQPSPLPQEEIPGRTVPTRVLHGFTQFLPARNLIFFQRVYFANYPRPLQQGGGPPFPVPIVIAQIEAPNRQVIVIKNVNFEVYQHSGIGIEDIIAVPPSRVATYFGFQFQVGNRGTTDYSSNLNARGAPVNFGGNVGTSLPPAPGQSSFYPFSGRSNSGLDNFATYARPRDLLSAKALLLRAPEYDTRLFSVEISGYLLEESDFDKVLQRLGVG